MSEMVERVARALQQFPLCVPVRPSTRCLERPTAERMARAAIAAMREPTEEMRRVVAADWGRKTWQQYRDVIDAAANDSHESDATGNLGVAGEKGSGTNG